MMKVWINPNKALLTEKEQAEWVELMEKYHPGYDWKQAIHEINTIYRNVSGTGRKRKKD